MIKSATAYLFFNGNASEAVELYQRALGAKVEGLMRYGDVQVALAFDDRREAARCFEALASGGKVAMGLHDAFWGETFGMLTDRFGIGWMFTAPKAG